MAHVLILSLAFPPDSTSTAHLMGELVVDLMVAGHRVSVITTMPHNNRDAEAEAAQPIRRRWPLLLGESDFRGARVLHTLMPRKGPNVLMRLVGWAGFHAIGLLAGLSLGGKPDVIFAPSPPLTDGLVAWLLGAAKGAPFVYNVQEVYPDIAVRLGAVKNRVAVGLLRRLEDFVYQKAARVTVIGEGMRKNLLAKGVAAEKVEVVPNWVDTGEMRPLEKSNDFSRGLGIDTSFVVSYAGNIGPAQGLECILDAADALRDEPRIRFLVMGDGSWRARFEKLASERDLPNLILLSYQPRSIIPQVYAASDLNLIPQAPETGGDALPSKVYRIMACGRALLAVTESGSDLAALVREVGCGLVVEPGDTGALVGAIQQAFKDREGCRRMGSLGGSYAGKKCARAVVTGRYEAMLAGLATPREIRPRH